MASIELRISRMETALDAGNPYANWTDKELDERIHHLRQSLLRSFVLESNLLTGPMQEADRAAVTLLVGYLRRIDQFIETEDTSHELTDAELREAIHTCRDLLTKYRPDETLLAEFDELMRWDDAWPR